ncbi:hypothetical protein [Pseudomonas sp. BP8]|uniref:hypothetical protein n=1 Tax=Pseudomonas sp. BP8 TaxID=2817864 RepID=UPI001AE597FB|nr:hypothetical protein [Pseudomonas sp. BP8]MBP2263462.1 hypothetical protein [Pseudomonas sp. BP8]HDS1736958.1 hypothetical protein [Pseudomonas putida]
MSKIRALYTVVSVLGLVLAFIYYPKIVAENTAFNTFSYVGGVATFIGLFIAIAEIFNELWRARSIQEEAVRLLERVKNIDHVAAISHCLSTLDEVVVCFEREDYHGALKSFRYFRRMVISLYKRFGVQPDDVRVAASKKMGVLGELEALLSSATHTTEKAPLGNAQRILFRRDMLQIKHQIETHMHVEGEKYAA